METDAGQIRLEMFGTDAPNTVANFVKLAKDVLAGRKKISQSAEKFKSMSSSNRELEETMLSYSRKFGTQSTAALSRSTMAASLDADGRPLSRNTGAGPPPTSDCARQTSSAALELLEFLAIFRH